MLHAAPGPALDRRVKRRSLDLPHLVHASPRRRSRARWRSRSSRSIASFGVIGSSGTAPSGTASSGTGIGGGVFGGVVVVGPGVAVSALAALESFSFFFGELESGSASRCSSEGPSYCFFFYSSTNKNPQSATSKRQTTTRNKRTAYNKQASTIWQGSGWKRGDYQL